jgi:hypothetical protein
MKKSKPAVPVKYDHSLGSYSANIFMGLTVTRIIDTSSPYLKWALPLRGETMKSSRRVSDSRLLLACLTVMQGGRSVHESSNPKIRRVMLLLLATAAFAAMPLPSRSQSLSLSGDSSASATTKAPSGTSRTYVRPTERTKAGNYAFDAFGPYPIAGAAFAAGINQLDNAPPEWNQGLKGYGKRFGSDFAIAAVGTTTRYGLAEAFKEDTLYYRCECTGPFPRMRHAVISTLTARRGQDGHRVFSIPALIAPYAGSMTAVYGWFPDRFGAKDAFRMGNYSMLGYVGGNIALEFLYSGPHALMSRLHLNNAHGSPDPGPNH